MDTPKHYNYHKYVIEAPNSLGGSGRNIPILLSVIDIPVFSSI